jgi:hypothetical protein
MVRTIICIVLWKKPEFLGIDSKFPRITVRARLRGPQKLATGHMMYLHYNMMCTTFFKSTDPVKWGVNNSKIELLTRKSSY